MLDTRSLEAELVRAEASVLAAQAEVDRWHALPRKEDLPPLEASVAAAQAVLNDRVDQARVTEDAVRRQASTERDMSIAKFARDNAAAELDRAKAALARAMAGGWKPDLEIAEAALAQSQAQVKQMLSDGELLMGLTFNPNEPANLVTSGELPETTIAWQHRAGTIGNTHFLAIPVNARASAAAQVTANFLLSPEAQARKADLAVWGDPTVLDLNTLSPAGRALFAGGNLPGAVSHPARTIPEPHGSWVPLIEAAWLERYGA
jgi:putative thiamine transport system substrate-binding protein